MFFVSRLLPGDPVMLIVGDHPTIEQIEAANEKLGFNKPILVQFGIYLGNLFKGDFGISLRTKQPVSIELGNRFAATFELVTISLLLAMIIGFPLGILSAYYRETKSATSIRAISFSARFPTSLST